MKCEHCGGTSWRENARKGVECSGCGAPMPNVKVFETAPFYVMTTKNPLRPETYGRIQESWKSMFEGDAPKLMILEDGVKIEVLPSHHYVRGEQHKCDDLHCPAKR